MKVEEFLDRLEGILKDASDGIGDVRPCFYTKTNGDPILTVEDVAQAMAASAFHSTTAALRGVSCALADGGSAVICYTGNGPHSEATAYFIATAFSAVPELIRHIREQRAEIEALRKDREIADALVKFIRGIFGPKYDTEIVGMIGRPIDAARAASEPQA